MVRQGVPLLDSQSKPLTRRLDVAICWVHLLPMSEDVEPMCGHARYSRWRMSWLDEMEEMIHYLLEAILEKAAARRGSRPIDETGLTPSIIDAYCNSQTRHAKPAILRKNGYQLYYHLNYKHIRYSQCCVVVTLHLLRIANYKVSHSPENA